MYQEKEVDGTVYYTKRDYTKTAGEGVGWVVSILALIGLFIFVLSTGIQLRG